MVTDHYLGQIRSIGRSNFRREFASMVDRARVPRLRSIRQWAEDEMIMSGAHPGPFRCHRQPFSRFWLDAIDDSCGDNQYIERVLVGPSQSGKTVLGFVFPVLYHLFEVGETVVAAVPDADMISDKWEKDLEPAISSSRYRSLLPAMGSGSRGGRFKKITFKNGQTLRFMSAHGDDKSVAGFTTRVICFTETDGFDRRAETSKESTKIAQIEARCRAYDLTRRRIYKECTATVPSGHIWDRYQKGTATKISLQCPVCRSWVSPEREDYHGWQGAANEKEAVRNAHFRCPDCLHPWTELQRIDANRSSKIVHRGQEIGRDGEVLGLPPETFTFGFRWSAVNNCLISGSSPAIDEFKSQDAVDEDNALRELSQFIWAVPYVPKDLDEVAITSDTINRRVISYGRGQVPEDTQTITVGIDVGKYVCHWVAMCWRSSGSGHVLDYGTQGVKVRQLGFGKAIKRAVLKIRESLGTGWTHSEVAKVLVDCRYKTGDVVSAIKEVKSSRWRPAMGLGKGHWSRRQYKHPERIGGNVLWAGNSCYEKLMTSHRATFIFADANIWKTSLHESLAIEYEDGNPPPGSISVFAAVDSKTHATFRRHLTAEKERFAFEAGVGHVRVWDAVRSENHYLDATYLACVAGHRCGFDLSGQRRKSATNEGSVASIASKEFDELDFNPFS